MLSATDVTLRVGSRTLISQASFRIGASDRIGLVGRNGAGKSTLMKVLAGLKEPQEGVVNMPSEVGYLPQDPRTTNMSMTAMQRIMSARGLDELVSTMERTQGTMSRTSGTIRERAMREYDQAEQSFVARDGYAAQSQAAGMCANLGLDEEVVSRPLSTLSGGQRRRVELARILFSDTQLLLLDEPTNHLDADAIVWLRNHLQHYRGGLLVISHDVELLDAVINRVLTIDATRGKIDAYNLGWKAFLKQREVDERRRSRERRNAEKKAAALAAQAERMRAKATKARAAKQMFRRAEGLLDSSYEAGPREKVAALRFPSPIHCGAVPLSAQGLSRVFGSQEVFTNVDLAIDKGSRVVVLGLNGAGKTTLLRLLAGVDQPDTGKISAGTGLRIGYYAQEHENLDPERTVYENMRSAAPDLDETGTRNVLGSFLFSGDDVHKPAGVLSGGEKTRLALAILVVSAANVLLLDEPTNNLDPQSREEVLDALGRYEGAVVLVTHDEGAVTALNPERVLLLPDGVEDFWNPDYTDLIALA